MGFARPESLLLPGVGVMGIKEFRCNREGKRIAIPQWRVARPRQEDRDGPFFGSAAVARLFLLYTMPDLSSFCRRLRLHPLITFVEQCV